MLVIKLAGEHQASCHIEENNSRLLKSMRQTAPFRHPVSALEDHDDDDDDAESFMAGLPRMKKDKKEMDEDARLLASEEVKKLSIEEWRNKVSGRAFRARRKCMTQIALSSIDPANTSLRIYCPSREWSMLSRTKNALLSSQRITFLPR